MIGCFRLAKSPAPVEKTVEKPKNEIPKRNSKTEIVPKRKGYYFN